VIWISALASYQNEAKSIFKFLHLIGHCDELAYMYAGMEIQ